MSWESKRVLEEGGSAEETRREKRRKEIQAKEQPLQRLEVASQSDTVLRVVPLKLGVLA